MTLHLASPALPPLPTFSLLLLCTPHTSSSTSSILGWRERSLQHPVGLLTTSLLLLFISSPAKSLLLTTSPIMSLLTTSVTMSPFTTSSIVSIDSIVLFDLLSSSPILEPMTMLHLRVVWAALASPRLPVMLPASESRSLEERETGEKGRKEEACEEEGEGSATTRELRKGGWGRKEEVVESVGERMEEVSENISQLGERGMGTGLSLPWALRRWVGWR